MLKNTDNEKFRRLSKEFYNHEEIIDFLEWYAGRQGLLTIIGDDGYRYESDLQECLDDFRRIYDAEIDAPRDFRVPSNNDEASRYYEGARWR